MNNSLLASLLDQFGREVAPAPILVPPCDLAHSLPATIKSLYLMTDGIRMPFLELFPASGILELPGLGPDWKCFGSDGYFSYCLVSRDGLDLWDHEAGTQPEPAFESVEELLSGCYRNAVEESSMVAELVVNSVPAGHEAGATRLLKTLLDLPTASVLERVRSAPLRQLVPRSEGLRTIRALQALGVACHLDLQT